MKMLADYSVQENDLNSRQYPEKEHIFRSPFQRDRDRIVHSKAFRRLEYKTQVFVNYLGDNYRTRLTHSLEVSQVSRTVARALKVNEDLAESIALAHDIGHPPFGHAGERVLNLLMKDHGGFNHNKQALRVVTELEESYPQFKGLNLSKATLMGLEKHSKILEGKSPTIEAQIVNVCDEITYNSHDLDDGIESGLLSIDQLQDLEIWQDLWKKTNQDYASARFEVRVRYTIRSLFNLMVMDIVENSLANIQKYGIRNLDDVLYFHKKFDREKIVSFSENLEGKVKLLKKYLLKELCNHPNVVQMNLQAKTILNRIFQCLVNNTDALPFEFQVRLNDKELYRTVCDFIAGMTDRYAIKWNQKILGLKIR